MDIAPYLPIAVSDFRTLRTHPDYLYVDKTPQLAALASGLLGGRPQTFLTRPRRFGKSLLVSALAALFRGERELFDRTWIGEEGNWPWEAAPYPVLILDMSLGGIHTGGDLAVNLKDYLRALAEEMGTALTPAHSPSLFLANFIAGLYRQHGHRKIVVLIDEYDAPITKTLDVEENWKGDVNAAFRHALPIMRDFYGALKSSQRFIECLFMTGVTRFARASLYSGANHFSDISFAGEFNALLGFTERELDAPAVSRYIAQCAERLPCAAGRLRAALRDYYNGYCFSRRAETVYNPLSLAECLFEFRQFETVNDVDFGDLPNAWMDSGAPALLFNLMKSGDYRPAAKSVINSPNLLRDLRLNKAAAPMPDYAALMYHAGYLTLKRNGQGDFYLGLPNTEVATAFNDEVLRWQNECIQALPQDGLNPWGVDLKRAFLKGDTAGVKAGLDNYFRQLPSTLTRFPEAVKTIASYEMYYQNMLFGGLKGSRFPVRAEESTAEGFIDIVMEWPGPDRQATIMELKTRGTVRDALDQVWARGYVDGYRTTDRSVRVFGLTFDTENRSLADVAVWSLGTYDAQAARWDNEPNPDCTLTALSRENDKRRRAEIVAAWDYPIRTPARN